MYQVSIRDLDVIRVLPVRSKDGKYKNLELSRWKSWFVIKALPGRSRVLCFLNIQGSKDYELVVIKALPGRSRVYVYKCIRLV